MPVGKDPIHGHEGINCVVGTTEAEAQTIESMHASKDICIV